MRIKTSFLIIIIMFSSIMALMVSKTNDEVVNEKISVPETPETPTSLNTPETPTSPNTPETPTVSESVNKKPLEWYYDNLSPDNRKKIRQAMDMAIPRDEIVYDIKGGWGVRETATPIGPQYYPAYDPSIQARDYNIGGALDLLEQVFGYRYDSNANDETRDPYFHMTLVVPTSNLARTQWASLIGSSFGKIGIDVDLKWWNWNILTPRVFTDPVGIGFDYEHGGYDAYFVGYGSASTGGMNTNTKGIDFSDMYTSDNFAPNGENSAWIDSAVADDIWYRAINSTSMAEQMQALVDFQAWFYDEVPKSVVFQGKDVYAMDSSLSGFDRLHSHNFQNWTLAKTDLTYVQRWNFSSFNPLFSLPRAWQTDLSVSENVHGSLTKIRGEHNLTHPVGFLADSWTHSPDYLTWNVNLKQGVLWHDGTEVTAEDVVYTYKAVFNDTIGVDSNLLEVMTDIFGDASNIEQLSTYQVKFTLPDFHPFVESLGFGLTILQKAQMELIPPSNWRDHGTNLGTEQLQGFGPYYFDGFDGTTVTLSKADTYNDLRMGHDPSAVGGGIWWPNASIATAYIKVVQDPEDAFDNLKTGVYDVIDHLMEIDQHYNTIAVSTWGKLVETPTWGWQELTYNQYSPIWGMNPQDPRGMYPDPLPEPVSNLEDYYDNLTPEKRKKVRQAMDIAIPRDDIIEGILGGYALKSATPIDEKFVGVHDPSIQARDFDLEQAKDLLQDVFGYRYNVSGSDGSEDTYFDMTLSAPTSRQDRIRWAGFTALRFQQIGINVTLKLWDWGIGLNRIFDDPVSPGFDYNHGGFDAFFIGWTDAPTQDLRGWYSSDNWAPDGRNYNWINDATADDISNRTWNSDDIVDRIQALKDFQNWYYDEVPKSFIRQGLDLWAMDPNLIGFDPYLGYNVQNWTIGSQTSAVIAQPADFFRFNPLLTDSYYDSIVLDNIFCSLSRRRGVYNLTHAVPWLAESWTHSPDYLTWDVILRQGIKWSDGTEVTAADVVFTYQAAMDEDTGSVDRGTLLEILGDASNVEQTGPYGVRFTLPEFHPQVETVLFGLDILQKAQMSDIPFANWEPHATSTQYSPIGCGPYQFYYYDYVDTIDITVNPYYDETKMGHDPNMLGGGNWLPDPTLTTVTFKVVKDPFIAITDLENREIDFIDRNIYIQGWANEIVTSGWGKLVNSSQWQFQELGYNQFSPIWGMNPEDPRVMYPLDYPLPEFNLIDSSITPVSTGVYQFNATVINDGAPATLGTLPISWEKVYYELPLVDGAETLYESIVDLDLNGDGDKSDTFDVTWHRTETRQWDAMIGGVRASSLCEGPPGAPWSVLTYYRYGQPKLFQLGNMTHALYMADNNVAAFGLGDVFISSHPSANFAMYFNTTDLSATDFRINGISVKTNYTWIGRESSWTGEESSQIYLQNYPFEIGTGESVTFSCTIIGHWRTTPCELALIVNWSPDGNTRLRWVPLGQSLLIELPEFDLLNYSLTPMAEGVYQFEVDVQNTGAPATSGTLPLSWEKAYYELPLIDGEGTLYESIVDLDLNGDGDKNDFFEVSWFHNETRSWDAIISGVHAYSRDEGPPEQPNRIRTFYLNNGQSKLFQLGSETHFLYRADNNYAGLGFGIKNFNIHPSPNFELYFNTNDMNASEFYIDEIPVEVDLMWSGSEQIVGEDLWFSKAYVAPNYLFEIDTGQTISFSCTLTVQKTVDCFLGLVMNWSPDNNSRCTWAPVWEESVQLGGPPVTGSAAPILSSPASGTTLSSTTAILQWTLVTDAVEYQVQVDTSSTFASPEFNVTGTLTTVTTSPLENDYYAWRVRCKDALGTWGSWSDVWYFTIDVPPDTTTTTTTTSEGETSEAPSIPSPGPGFEVPLILMVFVVGIVLKRKLHKKRI